MLRFKVLIQRVAMGIVGLCREAGVADHIWSVDEIVALLGSN
jgi:hypothetical protein